MAVLFREKNILRRIKENVWADIIAVLLALFSVALLVFELSAELYANQVALVHTIDIIIAFVFLLDFLIGVYLAENRSVYVRQNWPDLLASIPISEGLFRTLRALRILRLVRVIRVIARIRRLGVVAETVADNSSRYIYVASVTSIVILSGAVAFFSMELDVNPDVNNFFDAIWWAVVTSTTVGYGDIFPVTWEGRVIGMLLMFFGIGLVGTVAGFVGSYFLERKRKP
jgi:voltage-gated potassium channel